jgi:cell surface protein SprA
MKKTISFTYLYLLIISTIIVSCHKESEDIKIRNIDLKYLFNWHISSTPLCFREANLQNNLAYGFNRAHVAWYYIDPLFNRNSSYTPTHLTADDQSNHYVREVQENEISENSDLTYFLNVFNISYYPAEKGQYNYDSFESEHSKGINSEGKLNNPETRWAGIQSYFGRDMSKVSYIDFWLMDPFIYDNTLSGDLYFNLGDISEDILKDNRLSFEGEMPISDISIDTNSVWGQTFPITDSINSFYDNKHDVGLDGLDDDEEKVFFANYLNSINGIVSSSDLYSKYTIDPSSDNYHYFLGSDNDSENLGIIERYKYYNGTDGDSKISTGSDITSSTMNPDVEDVNRDGRIDTTNNYYEYRIVINKSNFTIGSNYIDEIREPLVTLKNGKQEKVKWYHFKIPISSYESKFGPANSIEVASFIRMYLTNFKNPVILRFAHLILS